MEAGRLLHLGLGRGPVLTQRPEATLQGELLADGRDRLVGEGLLPRLLPSSDHVPDHPSKSPVLQLPDLEQLGIRDGALLVASIPNVADQSHQTLSLQSPFVEVFSPEHLILVQLPLLGPSVPERKDGGGVEPQLRSVQQLSRFSELD